MTAIDRMLAAAQDAGMNGRQLRLFLRAGYLPQPKQMEFHAACRLADAHGGPTEIGFGGARGPGKSHALLAQIALDDCQRHDNLKVLLLRRVGKAVREAFEDQRGRVLAAIPHDYNRSSGTVTFSNGSRIILGHFQNESDVDAYLGLEYDVIAVEEATTLTESKYKAIHTCNRTSKDDWRPRVYSNTNPGGVGHNWYKERFVLPWRRGHEVETRFIPATVHDNVFVNEMYVETLDELTGWKRRAWLLGDWDIAVGQYFTTFSFDRHVVDPFEVPDHWPRVWVGLDYGWTHPTAAVVLAQNHQGEIYAIADYARSKELPATHIRNLNQILDRPPYLVAGGGDMWQPNSEGTVVAEAYEAAFPMLQQADMSRVSGAEHLLQLLGDERNPPKLRFFRNTHRTYNQLAAMQHNPNRPEDVLKVDADEEGHGGDDLYDALRYGVMAVRQEQSVWTTTLTY